MSAPKTYTLALIKSANANNGGHFFDKAAMRGFSSRVSEKVHNGPGGVYFVTSEQYKSLRFDNGPRLYSVRQFHPETKGIDTAGVFQGYTSAYQAHKAAALFAATPNA